MDGARSARCWAVVVAAGRGRRLNLSINKVFYTLLGRSVLRRGLDALTQCGGIEGVVLVLSPQDMDAYRALIAREGENPCVRRVVSGGNTRQQSVWAGLCAVPQDVELIAIHDAARAFVPESVVLETIEAAALFGSGVAASPVIDTIKRVNAREESVETLTRSDLRAVQTPQTFQRALICEAHARARADAFEATDDAALVERYFGPVRLVVSEEGLRNRKLTTQEDLTMIKGMLGLGLRVGHGFDAHRLVPGRPLVLCGVTIAHESGLDGHSDADVAVHALMDALIGAAGMGDIGRLFPDDDPAYEGICSMLLLEQVASMLRERDYAVVNCDVTIVAQRPKLMGYMHTMRDNVARALRVNGDCVNVKATTTERMGYEGRMEGISASAVAILASK